MLNPLEQSRRIADDGGVRCDITDDDCTHSHNGPFTNDQRLSRSTLVNNGPRTDISAVLNADIAVAPYGRRKRHEITNPTVVLDIRVNIAVKIPTNADVTGQHRKITNYGAVSNQIFIEDDCRRRDEIKRTGARTLTNRSDSGSGSGIGNGNGKSDLAR